MKKLICHFILFCFINLSIGLNFGLSFDYEAFTKSVEKALKDWGTAGAAITIVKDGKVAYTKCFGVKTAGGSSPVTEDTQFMIVSIGKGITAFLMALLHQEGLLNLDDPVQKYLPDFKLSDPTVAQEFKVKDLLAHNSGLPDFSYDSLVETGWSDGEIYAVLDKIPLKNKFREKFGYQNIFPGIAGMLAQKVTKIPLSTLYQTYVFQPLGFQDTTIGEKGLTGSESLYTRLKANITAWFTNQRVSAHYLKDGQPFIIQGDNPAIYRFPASRGINASIRDMAKWLQFWQTGVGADKTSPLSDNLMKLFFEKRTDVGPPRGGTLFPKERVTEIAYGLGWYIYNYGPLKEVYGHMGGMTGTRSLIVMVPELNIAMVVVINVGGMRVNLAPEAIRNDFLDRLIDTPENRDWSAELLQETKDYRQKVRQQLADYRLNNPQKAHDLDAYVGEYKNDLYGILKVTKEKSQNPPNEEQLVLHYRHLKAPLDHWNGDNFTLYPPTFSRAYSATDMCNVMFGYDPRTNRADVMMVDLLSEGADSKFHRIQANS
jgi:CubicO group peptidase (beta-lactamase class C family)